MSTETNDKNVVSEEDIKTILTHEQYEQNCYKVKWLNETKRTSDSLYKKTETNLYSNER